MICNLGDPMSLCHPVPSFTNILQLRSAGNMSATIIMSKIKLSIMEGKLKITITKNKSSSDPQAIGGGEDP